MIPLTKENREGLQLMVELCAIPSGPRDPRVTGAMAWAENLPRGPIDPWPVRLDSNCAGCPLGDHGGSHRCQLSWILYGEDRPCSYEAVPPWCRLRGGGAVIITGIGP